VRVSIHAAKINLSRLIEKAQSGEEIIITKSGQPVARVTPIRTKRDFGSAAGRIVFRKNWDLPMSAKELKTFLGP
jgi:prevent-host-death family protein